MYYSVQFSAELTVLGQANQVFSMTIGYLPAESMDQVIQTVQERVIASELTRRRANAGFWRYLMSLAFWPTQRHLFLYYQEVEEVAGAMDHAFYFPKSPATLAEITYSLESWRRLF
jgi:hypothetical protein